MIPKRSFRLSSECDCRNVPLPVPLVGASAKLDSHIEGLCETVSALAWHAGVTASVLSWVSIEDKLEDVGTKAFDKLGLTQKKSKFPLVPCSPTPIPGLQEKEPFSGETVACTWPSGTGELRWTNSGWY